MVIGFILMVIAGAGILHFWKENGTFDGAQGLKGDIGLQGPQGLRGPQGGPGLKGEKGDTGSRGAAGSAGKDGEDGKDAPVNQFPFVAGINLSGFYSTGWHSAWYTFNFSALAQDSDGTQMKATIYYREDPGDDWEQTSMMYTYDGLCNDTVSFYRFGCPQNTTVYWGVELWDGSDLVFSEFDYTIIVSVLL